MKIRFHHPHKFRIIQNTLAQLLCLFLLSENAVSLQTLFSILLSCLSHINVTLIVSLLCGWFALESDSAFLAKFFSKHDRDESGFYL